MKYLVLAIRGPKFTAEAGAAHQAWLSELREQGRLEMNGGFTDGTGGAYLLRAGSLDEARAMAAEDPLEKLGVSTLTVWEWNAR